MDIAAISAAPALSTRRRETSSEVFDMAARLGEAGLLTLTAPKALGGGGAGYRAATRLVCELAHSDPAAARMAAKANFGAMGAILRCAPEALRRRAVSMARAGAPPHLIGPERSRCKAERRGEGWILTGEAAAPRSVDRCALFVVAAEVLGKKRSRAALQAFFLLDRDRDVGIIRRHDVEGRAGGTLLFDAVELPNDRALGMESGPLSAGAMLAPQVRAEGRLAEACALMGGAATSPAAELAINEAAAIADRNGRPDPASCSRAYDLAAGRGEGRSEERARAVKSRDGEVVPLWRSSAPPHHADHPVGRDAATGGANRRLSAV